MGRCIEKCGKIVNILLAAAVSVSCIVCTTTDCIDQNESEYTAEEDVEAEKASSFPEYAAAQKTAYVKVEELDRDREIMSEQPSEPSEQTQNTSGQVQGTTAYFAKDPILATDGSPSEENLSICSQKLAEIPQALKDRFIADGWTFFMTSDKIGDTILMDGMSYQGLTVYAAKRIYIENRQKAARGATIHEFGHYVGMMAGTVSASMVSQEWGDIFIEESTLSVAYGMDSYGQTNPCEYFAECFVWYIEQPGDLQRYLPRSYEYINNCVNAYFYSE